MTAALDMQRPARPLLAASSLTGPGGETWHAQVFRPGVVELSVERHGQRLAAGTLSWDGQRLARAQPAPQGLEPNRHFVSGLADAMTRTQRWGHAIASDADGRVVAAAQRVYGGRGVRPETLAHPAFRHSFTLDPTGALDVPVHNVNGLVPMVREGPRLQEKSCDGLWVSAARPTDRQLVLVAGPCDALAYHQLNPSDTTRYVSVNTVSMWGPAGEMTRDQRNALGLALAAMPERSSVVAAFDLNSLGRARMDEVQRLAPGVAMERALPPIGRSWSETLERRERDFIRTQLHAQLDRKATALER